MDLEAVAHARDVEHRLERRLGPGDETASASFARGIGEIEQGLESGGIDCRGRRDVEDEVARTAFQPLAARTPQGIRGLPDEFALDEFAPIEFAPIDGP